MNYCSNTESCTRYKKYLAFAPFVIIGLTGLALGTAQIANYLSGHGSVGFDTAFLEVGGAGVLKMSIDGIRMPLF